MKKDILLKNIKCARRSHTIHMNMATFITSCSILDFSYLFGVVSIGFIITSTLFPRLLLWFNGLAALFSLLSILAHRLFEVDKVHKAASIRLILSQKYNVLYTGYASGAISFEDAFMQYKKLGEYELGLWKQNNVQEIANFVEENNV
jgi:hypothetical protein